MEYSDMHPIQYMLAIGGQRISNLTLLAYKTVSQLAKYIIINIATQLLIFLAAGMAAIATAE